MSENPNPCTDARPNPPHPTERVDHPFVLEVELDKEGGQQIYDKIRRYWESREFIPCRLTDVELTTNGSGALILRVELAPDWFITD